MSCCHTKEQQRFADGVNIILNAADVELRSRVFCSTSKAEELAARALLEEIGRLRPQLEQLPRLVAAAQQAYQAATGCFGGAGSERWDALEASNLELRAVLEQMGRFVR